MNSEFKIDEDETLDGPNGLKVIQKRGYYRYSQDSLQLANFADVRKNDTIIDLGTGCGVIALILAQRGLGRKISGLEIQGELAEIARRNVRLNGFQEKIEIVEGDIREIDRHFAPDSFEYVITNPPYVEVRVGIGASPSKKALARHEILCNMDDTLRAMKYLLKSLRRGACVYPAARFGELVFKAASKNLLPKRVQFIYSNPGENAELVLVEFIKEGKPGLEILPPLISQAKK